MKTRYFSAIALSLTLTLTARAVDNSWTDGNGKWETPGNWSAGTPDNSNAIDLITNAATKTVTIDAVTTGTPSSLTISNLTMSASVNATNTLRIINTGAFSLQVLNGLTLLNGSAVTVSNANLRVDGLSFGFFGVDGGASLLSGSITVTNVPTYVGALGSGSVGTLSVNGGTMLARDVTVGEFSTSVGTFTVAGGTVLLSDALNVGLGGLFDTDVGTVWVTGGQLTVTNGPTILGDSVIGVPGQGQMTVSNGTVTVGDLIIAQSSSAGTLTMAGGTLTADRLLAINSGGTIVFPAGIMTLRGAEVANGQSFLIGGTGQTAVLNLVAGTNRFANAFSIGPVAGSTGSVWLTGGQLIVTNSDTDVGLAGDGRMSVSNGTMLCSNVVVGSVGGSQGTLTIAGGITTLSGTLTAGLSANATGAVWVTGGQLVMSTNAFIARSGVGQMTMSNGTVLANGLFAVAFSPASRGVVTVSGGILQLLGGLLISDDLNATGRVFVTGGQLIVTNGLTRLGDFKTGFGELTVSNGALLARDMIVGGRVGTAPKGVFTVAGGTNILSSSLNVGSLVNATGSVFVSAGLLVVTNDVIVIGSNGVGQVTQTGGTMLLRDVRVAFGFVSQGTLTVSGGTGSVFSNLTVGNFPCAPTGTVVVAGGNLFVTNSTVSAVLEVRTGTLTLNSGVLMVDKFVMTNACAHFARTGGTLILNSIPVLDPTRDDDGDGIPNGYEQAHGLDPLNPADANVDSDGDGLSNLQEFIAGTDATNSVSSLRITSIMQSATNVLVTWMMGPGKTNALERTAGTAGNFSTNGFAAIFTATNTTGTVTNYLDVGAAGATSTSRFYRVRLVP